MLSLSACAVGTNEPDSEELVGAPEENVAESKDAITGSVAVGSTLTATADVNLRTGASTSYKILHVVPNGAKVTVVASAPSNGFYKVKHNGVTGWSYGQYYKASSTSTGSTGGSSTSRDAAIARAKTAMGFSYWWGHGRFATSGATSSNKGSCSGSCPSCSHGGSYGGDCSGLAAKVWQVPGSNSSMSTDSHPYSTANFNVGTSQWSVISRGNVKKADAMVYNESGHGHIFIYESGDGWGSMYSYECKGCSYGCVHNLRTASSAYKAIRRAGY
ncbi:Hypothetical protein A7982_00598 [Minicystis rosea]|nr:Hypothetical protein A7982_00598 [Minicystis rosea]